MALPHFADIQIEILNLLSDQRMHTGQEITGHLTKKFGLIRSGEFFVPDVGNAERAFAYEVKQALSLLKSFVVDTYIKQDTWMFTAEGLANAPQKIKDLRAEKKYDEEHPEEALQDKEDEANEG